MQADKIQEYYALLDKAGGQNTSKMNELHGIVVEKADQLPGSILRTDIIERTRQAEGHNQVVGDTLAEMVKWGKANLVADSVEPPPVTPPSGPPVTIGPGLVSPPLQPWELRRLIGAGDAIYWMGVTAGGQIGNALGSGSFWIYGAVVDTPPAPGTEPAWQQGGTAIHAPIPIKVGQFYVWKFTGTASQEMRPQLQA